MECVFFCADPRDGRCTDGGTGVGICDVITRCVNPVSAPACPDGG
jgi:hypothetical protein